MSLLKTYAPPTPIVPWETRRYDGPLKPGDWVTHSEYGGHGIIVAIDSENMTVLWSREPQPRDFSSGFIYAPYIPMQVTPTIFDPEDFKPKGSMLTRYAKKLLKPEWFASIKIEDIK